MAEIRSFKAYRPISDVAGRVAALPYDVYNREEAETEVRKEPLSFLKIDRAETSFSREVDTYDPVVYERANELLNEMITQGIFIQEQKPVYYIYELIMDGRHQTGLVACASIDDYLNGIIKKHENTRADKELDRINHVTNCRAHTGPIFLAYRAIELVDDIINRTKQGEKLYGFTASDGVTHNVWIIEDAADIAAIKASFRDINDIYIADGHHRAASAVKAGLKQRELHPDYTGEEEFNYFLSVLFPHDQLMIMPYNRVVADLAGHTEQEFMNMLAEKFMIELKAESFAPAKPGQFGMYIDGSWYCLTAHEGVIPDDVVGCLDVSVLQDNILGPLLDIDDPRTNNRIQFVGGIRGVLELERMVDGGMRVAFSMYPTSITQLFDIADAGLLMPPKSTWFEPKLRSGLFIHKF